MRTRNKGILSAARSPKPRLFVKELILVEWQVEPRIKIKMMPIPQVDWFDAGFKDMLNLVCGRVAETQLN